jgi:IS30 family transposase
VVRLKWCAQRFLIGGVVMGGPYRSSNPMPRAVRGEIRVRVARGETWPVVAASVGVTVRTVARVLQKAGPVPPRWTGRGRGQLSLDERVAIEDLVDERTSFAAIGRKLGRSTSTISREVDANGGRDGYRAFRADERAYENARRPKVRKLEANSEQAAVVVEMLLKKWSPQQVAGRLKLEFPDRPEMWVSHETIYESLYVQPRGWLRKELSIALRTGRVKRRPQGRLPRGWRLVGLPMISERPAEADDRAVPGHWEGDLIIGKNNQSGIVTLVERTSGFVMLAKIDDLSAETVCAAVAAKIETLPAELRRSLTWDQGSEMSAHAKFTVRTGLAVYFCDPHSPWQRGSNENTNGLLRQYFPKSTDLSIYSQQHLDEVAAELNDRPRQRFGWMKPSEKLAELVALTA